MDTLLANKGKSRWKVLKITKPCQINSQTLPSGLHTAVCPPHHVLWATVLLVACKPCSNRNSLPEKQHRSYLARLSTLRAAHCLSTNQCSARCLEWGQPHIPDCLVAPNPLIDHHDPDFFLNNEHWRDQLIRSRFWEPSPVNNWQNSLHHLTTAVVSCPTYFPQNSLLGLAAGWLAKQFQKHKWQYISCK